MTLIRILLPSCLVACSPSPAFADSTPTVHGAADDELSGAIQYMARRSEAWIGNNACVLSCHTTFAFAAVTDTGTPRVDAVRDEILAAVEARAVAWPPDDPWYATDETKVAQSLGTEAILNAFVLTRHERPAADRAIDNLLAQQRTDGGWDWLDFGLAPWETADAEVAGAALAAVAIAKARGEAASGSEVQRLRGYLRQRSAGAPNLHNRLFLVSADRALSGILDHGSAEATMRAAIAAQRPDGGWSNADLGAWLRADGQPNRADASDAYATGLVTSVLAGGSQPAQNAADRGRAWLRRHQRPGGRWAGRSLNDDDRFNRGLATDMATAYAILALTIR